MDDFSKARADVDQHRRALEQTSSYGVNNGEIEKQAAILGALVAREQAALSSHIAGQLMQGMEVLRTTIGKSTDDVGRKVEGFATLVASSETHLAGRIDAFTAATDASTASLARWTKVMAVATIVLAAFALAQVVVAVLAWLRPPH